MDIQGGLSYFYGMEIFRRGRRPVICPIQLCRWQITRTSEVEKLKLKGKNVDAAKCAVTPLKDEYEFDEDDEEERVPPVDDKHPLEKRVP
ncbi:hypothetical protein KUCAC02_001577 [Chaenocephalus aceratus]|uniref:Uncharacterized protein n=1 Tax=Chaenocephalus aceratus TaxID=36190 RepID=A0ACB9XSX4_CHAAC|nr:hypothetical protein KUCAC02_001577 [Chaenocephalus aceratus]